MRISIKTAGPFLLLTFVYFIVGFLTTVNGQCQGPLKVAFLSEVTENNNSLTTLISFSFFLGYLLNSSKTGRMMNRLGYKKTLIRSMIVMVMGVAFYLASALCAEYCSDVTINIGNYINNYIFKSDNYISFKNDKTLIFENLLNYDNI